MMTGRKVVSPRRLGWLKRWLGKSATLALGAAVYCGGLVPAWGAAPAVSQILGYRPRQQEVTITTPAPGTESGCKVELVKGQGKASGWLLRDGQGQPLRYFFDSNGDNHIDIWSYYHEGTEVYREIDTSFAGKPDQYRWLNQAGTRWGLDADRDGRIETWKVISPEEVSQEILQALIRRDFSRLEPLMLSDEEMKRIELPKAQVERVRKLREGAPAKFQKTLEKLTQLSAKARWLHLETGTPQCQPGDQTGSRYDLIRHPRGTVLFEVDGTTDWLQTGEMIQVGFAWRLVDAPVHGAVSTDLAQNPNATDLGQNPALLKLVEQLTALDKAQPPSGSGAGPALVRHYLGRAELLQRIVAEVKAQDREPWIRQLADSLSTAMQYSPADDTTAAQRLHALVQQVVAAAPASGLAAYATFREMQADYARKLAQPNVDFTKVQQGWVEQLQKFVQAYPQSDDAPDCLLQLGMVSEFLSKEVEAKGWYTQLTRNYSDKPQAAKAAGAIKRLELVGTKLRLAAPLLADANVAFDADQLQGKITIVYFWASWNSQTANDFARLKKVLEDHDKDVTVLGVNLDATAEEARSYLTSNPLGGTHVHQDGGLESRLAADHGIMVLPTLFLVGKDGKVLSNNAQIGTLEDEIKKLLK